MNAYLMIGVCSSFCLQDLKFGFQKESYQKMPIATKYFALMFNTLIITVLWPIYAFAMAWSVISGVSPHDYSKFSQYLKSTNQDWNTISELRELSAKFYVTLEEPVLEENVPSNPIKERTPEENKEILDKWLESLKEDDLWNASKDS